MLFTGFAKLLYEKEVPKALGIDIVLYSSVVIHISFNSIETVEKWIVTFLTALRYCLIIKEYSQDGGSVMFLICIVPAQNDID